MNKPLSSFLAGRTGFSFSTVFLCILFLFIIACGNSQKSAQAKQTPLSSLSLVPSETGIRVLWKAPPQLNAALKRITIHWFSQADPSVEGSAVITDPDRLGENKTGAYLIDGLEGKAGYGVEIFGDYQVLEPLYNEACELFYTYKVPTDETYSLLIGEGRAVTGSNIDGDELLDDEDEDKDGDGILNRDELPGCAAQYDCDGDGLADGQEPPGCILINDCDGDGTNDGEDVFPQDPAESSDTDGDGKGDNLDEDKDGDGILNRDELPGCAAQYDCDGDGLADGQEPPGCIREDDCDGDGTNDGEDAFPQDEDETKNTDEDQIGNNLDEDDDNDGVADEEDAFPLDRMENTDTDGDGIGDRGDPDDDGDGLIEIATAEEFNRIRYVLDGSGIARGSELVTLGCDGNNGTRRCNGYELVANISLAAYDWIPFALDRDNADFPLIATAFRARFDGRNHTISGLSIDKPSFSCVGLFGNAEEAQLQDLHLEFGNLSGKSAVGSLIGRAEAVTILSVSTSGERITGGDTVGGLIGKADYSDVRDSTALIDAISGSSFSVGGLLGSAQYSEVGGSAAKSEAIFGATDVGGLIGNGYSSTVVSSYALTGGISGSSSSIGGLIGYGSKARVSSSYAAGSVVATRADAVGGLIGDGTRSYIHNSSAEQGTVVGDGNVGGLVGEASGAFVNMSFARKERIRATEDAGGLIGDGFNATVLSSYARSNNIYSDREAGGLMGDSELAIINYSYAEFTSVFAQEYAGGLSADAEGTKIFSSYAIGSQVRAQEQSAGGLVGNGKDLRIHSSYAVVSDVRGEVVGGLVGNGRNSIIQDSFYNATNGLVRGYRSAGGLAGDARGAQILNSSSRLDLLIGDLNTGGLLGDGADARILSSYAESRIVQSYGAYAGGLVGEGDDLVINSSYATTGDMRTIDFEEGVYAVGGLIGHSEGAVISFSQATNHKTCSHNGAAGGLIGSGSSIRIYSSAAINNVLCGRSYIGGLVGTGNDMKIVSSNASTVSFCDIGEENIYIKGAAGLVGRGVDADIRDSKAINGRICKAKSGGGLVAEWRNTNISFSYAETERMDMVETGGGLLGDGRSAVVRSSYAATGTINASMIAGGLVGSGAGAILVADYAASDRLESRNLVGGLIGDGKQGWILSSYAVGGGLKAHTGGGLVGKGEEISLSSSYAAIGPLVSSQTEGLIGEKEGGFIKDSYWDLNLSSVMDAIGLSGAQTTRRLQQPVSYSGIYAPWTNTSAILPIEDVDDDLVRWCDRNRNGLVDEEERTEDNLLWDFGNSSQYPALTCVASAGRDPLSAQRYAHPIASPSVFPPLPSPISLNISFPEEIMTDPFLNQQWYLDRIGIKELWRQNMTGKGVHISIVDDALDLQHEDILPNLVPQASRNYLEHSASPLYDQPEPLDENEDSHGTAVTGIIAARGDNGMGIKGIAPDAGIYFSNYLQTQNLVSLGDALAPRTNQTAVFSNSWGSSKASRLSRSTSVFRRVVEENLELGYRGKGASYVFSAGNTREREDMASYEERLNHRGVITVCALAMDNITAPYSNRGPNLWLCAPSGMAGNECRISYFLAHPDTDGRNCGIATTDLSRGGYNQQLLWPLPGGIVLPGQRRYLSSSHWNFGGGDFSLANETGYIYFPPIAGNAKYTRFFSGTSAAAPMVSGVIAVLRAEYPHLSWRDIKLILAESAEQVDVTDASWQQTAPAYSNGSRFYTHSPNYGFGVIDAAAAGRLAADWKPLPPEFFYQTALVEGNDEQCLREEGCFAANTYSVSLEQEYLDFIEWTEIFIKSDQNNFAELEISLTSPHNTVSLLTRRHLCLESGLLSLGLLSLFVSSCDDLKAGFRFASAANIGQNPNGIWQLQVKGLRPSSSFQWQLKFYGHKRED